MPRCVVLPNINGRNYGFTLREIAHGTVFLPRGALSNFCCVGVNSAGMEEAFSAYYLGYMDRKSPLYLT